LPDNITPHTPQLISTAAAPDTGWAVSVLHVEEGSLFGTFHAEASYRFRYIAVTLEYVYRGASRTELYPDTVALVYTGSSPLQGLSQSPRLFFNEDTREVHRLNGEPVIIPVEAGLLQFATFVYEFHHDCREFCLYFPGCKGITISLAAAAMMPT
jgi:hypothetical protein